MFPARYPASRGFVMSSSITEPVHDVSGQVSGHVWSGFEEKVVTWALELERMRMDERRKNKTWVKKRNPYPFIKAVETVRLPTCPVNSLIPQAP